MEGAADLLDALRSRPGNRLEALKGNLAGKHSIRINDQRRIVFRWTNTGPEEVEIVDYHWSDRLPGVARENSKETSINSPGYETV